MPTVRPLRRFLNLCFLAPVRSTPQHKPRPPSSLCSTPSKKKPTTCSYDEQLRIAMEISAREQREAELRQQQEEEELQRIIQLSLMEKWAPHPTPSLWTRRSCQGGGSGLRGGGWKRAGVRLKSWKFKKKTILENIWPGRPSPRLSQTLFPWSHEVVASARLHKARDGRTPGLSSATLALSQQVPVYNQRHIRYSLTGTPSDFFGGVLQACVFVCACVCAFKTNQLNAQKVNKVN